jgi:predicted GNAT family acetyltransferase
MDVRHEPESERFVAVVDGQEAEVSYRREGDVLVITHTGVPEAIGGRGVAGDLSRAAFEFARASGLRVRPVCSYAAAWGRRNDEYADLIVA